MTVEYDKRKTAYTPVLSPCEQHIFRFIMRHSEQVRDMPIRELADLSNTSTTTIMRMAKKFGYPGYSGFRDEISRICDSNNGLFSGLSQYDLDYFFADTVRSPQFADALGKAAGIMEECETILFGGDREGKNIIDLACRLFAETGRNTGLISSGNDDMDTEKTCAVFILGHQDGGFLNGLCSSLNKSGIRTIVISSGSNCMIKDCSQMISCGLSCGIENSTYESVIPVVYVLEEITKKLSMGR